MISLSFLLLFVLAVLIRSCAGEKPVDRTIVGVKTSVAAFVDFFPEGPAHVATLIQSVSELEQQFGVLRSGNDAGYNVQQFFLNGGQEAWIIRVVGNNEPAIVLGDSAAPACTHWNAVIT